MKICVLGLGYVGLPLAASLSRHYTVTGFDVNERRIEELSKGFDATAELSKEQLEEASITYTAHEADLKNQDVYLVTVPTPVDETNKPDLSILETVSTMVGNHLSKGSIVVFESTVYPGVTEDLCGKALEKASGLKVGDDFFLGYSPERINPGDKERTIDKITKVVAGQNEDVTETLREIYSKVTDVFVAQDIKTAEAAKVIENAQRDINIAFMNEITAIFSSMGISTYDVLEAAKTKWNFLPFTPGLVGGHCIGVDPFYLAECAKAQGIDPQVILAGRTVNDGMGAFMADLIHKNLREKSRILILGLTFKENVPDLRNTKVVDLINRLKELGHDMTVADPLADLEEAQKYYAIDLQRTPSGSYDCVVGAVPHESYVSLEMNDFEALVKPEGLLVDLKNMWHKKTPPKRRFLRI